MQNPKKKKAKSRTPRNSDPCRSLHVQLESEILMQMVCLPRRGKHCRRNEPPGSWKSGRRPAGAHLGCGRCDCTDVGGSQCVLSSFSGVRLFATPWTVRSQPGSFVHGIFWARILEWVAISPSRASSQPRDRTHVFCISCLTGKFFTAESPGKPNRSHGSYCKPWELAIFCAARHARVTAF